MNHHNISRYGSINCHIYYALIRIKVIFVLIYLNGPQIEEMS